MARTLGELMTSNPVQIPKNSSVLHAAQAMRERNVGTVIVTDSDRPIGILTDRDVVIRGLAEGHAPDKTSVDEICSHELTTLTPEDSTSDAVKLMRKKAIRRLPIIKDGNIVGIVSLGDLALELDRKSALGDISAAPANR